jgi:redox-sensitive bicupin YhaK (pirin superfamily)
VPETIEERALHLVSGGLDVSGTSIEARQMAVLRPGSVAVVRAVEDAHLLLLGGGAMDGPRYIWWNFVASSVARIKSAAEDWKQARFGIVPGDEQEYIPLPDLPFPTEM